MTTQRAVIAAHLKQMEDVGAGGRERVVQSILTDPANVMTKFTTLQIDSDMTVTSDLQGVTIFGVLAPHQTVISVVTRHDDVLDYLGRIIKCRNIMSNSKLLSQYSGI